MEAIKQSLQNEAVLLSAISPWEVAMLVSKGRLTLNRDVGEWIASAVSLPGIRLEPIRPEIAVASTRLSGNLNADPADRLIVATARYLSAVLVTDDANLLDYAASGHLKAIRAGQ